jgi:hypothetical protein
VRTAQPHWLTGNLVRILFSVSDMAEAPETKGVPSLRGQLKSQIDIAALDFFGAPDEMQNPIFLPPGTPDAIVKVYRAAFNTAIADPAYRAEAEARSQRLEPRTGERVTEIVEAMHNAPPEVVERVKRATTIAR